MLPTNQKPSRSIKHLSGTRRELMRMKRTVKNWRSTAVPMKHSAKKKSSASSLKIQK